MVVENNDSLFVHIVLKINNQSHTIDVFRSENEIYKAIDNTGGVALSIKEASIFAYLFFHIEKDVEDREVAAAVWGWRYDALRRTTLPSYISNLRKKIMPEYNIIKRFNACKLILNEK